MPIGLVDDPSLRTQETWWLDFSGAGGHVPVIGAPQSARTTLLRTLAVSAALGQTPGQVSIHGIDLSGGGLSRIARFPHVGELRRGHNGNGSAGCWTSCTASWRNGRRCSPPPSQGDQEGGSPAEQEPTAAREPVSDPQARRVPCTEVPFGKNVRH